MVFGAMRINHNTDAEVRAGLGECQNTYQFNKRRNSKTN